MSNSSPISKSNASSRLKSSRSSNKSSPLKSPLKTGFKQLPHRSGEALQQLNTNTRERSISPKRNPFSRTSSGVKSTSRVQVFSDRVKNKVEQALVLKEVETDDIRRQNEDVSEKLILIEDEDAKLPVYATPSRPRIRQFPVGDYIGPLFKSRDELQWPLSAPGKSENIRVNGQDLMLGHTKRRLLEVFEDARSSQSGNNPDRVVSESDDDNKENIDPSREASRETSAVS
ncbi:hypothetical protein V1512DRAFT_245622 [Lipomyces arxii]|uniref:uncharacterized protein n=1 Tax=Lipomyces arxii TaxID=56418 RepID=UPI0034CFE129